jgi:hypothetical protein
MTPEELLFQGRVEEGAWAEGGREREGEAGQSARSESDEDCARPAGFLVL